MAVAIKRHRDRAVTHSHLDRLRMRTFGDRQRDARMAKVVEPALHSGGGLRLSEVMRQERTVRERRAGGVREHQSVPTWKRELVDVVAQLSCDPARDRDRPHTSARLRGTTDEAVVLQLNELLGDSDL